MNSEIREWALNLLGAAPLSSGKLREKLLKKGGEPEDVEEVLAWLQENRYVDDESLARSWIHNRLPQKGLSFSGVREFFFRHKVEEAIWKPLFFIMLDESEISQREWEVAQIQVLFQKKPSMIRLPQEKTQKRLMQRGFSFAAVKDAFEALKHEAK